MFVGLWLVIMLLALICEIGGFFSGRILLLGGDMSRQTRKLLSLILLETDLFHFDQMPLLGASKQTGGIIHLDKQPRHDLWCPWSA